MSYSTAPGNTRGPDWVGKGESDLVLIGRLSQVPDTVRGKSVIMNVPHPNVKDFYSFKSDGQQALHSKVFEILPKSLDT